MAVYKSNKVTKDGRKWYFSVWYFNMEGERSRKKSQKYKTRPEAQESERNFLINIKKILVDITFEEMFHQYIDYADETIKGSTKYCKYSRIKNHVFKDLGKMNIHDITYNTINNWKSTINKLTYGKDNKKYSLAYKRSIFAELKTTLKYGIEFCGLNEEVVNKVRTFQDKNETVKSDEEKIKYITPMEYNLYTSVITKIVYKVFFAFLYYMGVRKGEAQALYWEDILWDINKVRIIKTVTNKTDERDIYGNRFKITNTKNRKNRTIKMPLILKNLLLELYNYYKDFEGFNEKWFVFGGYRHLPSQSIDNEKDNYFDKVKETYGIMINRITNHEFRHSHASYLISNGVRVECIANRLGDTVEVVMKTYAHLFPETEEEIMDVLDLIEDKYKINMAIENSDIKKEFSGIKILQIS